MAIPYFTKNEGKKVVERVTALEQGEGSSSEKWIKLDGSTFIDGQGQGYFNPSIITNPGVSEIDEETFNALRKDDCYNVVIKNITMNTGMDDFTQNLYLRREVDEFVQGEEEIEKNVVYIGSVLKQVGGTAFFAMIALSTIEQDGVYLAVISSVAPIQPN